jgi:predicted nucleotidyltransferase
MSVSLVHRCSKFYVVSGRAAVIMYICNKTTNDMIEDSSVNEVISKIVDCYKPEKIIIFGSYARNEHTRDSDLDLLIVKDTDQSFVQRQRSVRSLFDKQMFAMDILVYTPAEFEKQRNWLNNIINIAIKTGKLVYERSN